MPIHRHVLHNGQLRDASEDGLRPGQVGLLSGWGVFSTLRVRDGVLFAWERHWARMTRDAAAMNVPMPEDPAQLRAQLGELIEVNEASNATLRLVVVRNDGSVWAGAPAPGESRFEVLALTTGLKNWSPLKLTLQPRGRYSEGEFSGAKVLSWAHNLTWAERAQAKGFDEPLLLNEKGEVAECTSCNIFVVNGNVVTTPPLSSGCLPGVTRAIVLEELRVPGIKLREEPLLPEDLTGADEVFVTSSTRDLLAAVQLDDRPLAQNGGVRRALNDAFQRYLTGYAEQHARAASAR